MTVIALFPLQPVENFLKCLQSSVYNPEIQAEAGVNVFFQVIGPMDICQTLNCQIENALRRWASACNTGSIWKDP